MKKPAPVYSLGFVFHPERDGHYVHFENAAANPFDPDPNSFPRVNAWWLAEAALLTYWNPADAIPLFQAAGFQCQFITAQGTDCYVATHDRFAIVAFRGTQPHDWNDILADVNVVLVPWKTGLVHLGFRKAFEAIRPQLDPLVAQALPGRTVWFCGHSLGAALATLAADHYPDTRGVCSLGSPRVGDSTFARAFDARFGGRSLRYVNDHDVVTHVPPPLGYAHVDVERFIAPDGTISGGKPAVPHFFAELFGKPAALGTMIQGHAKDLTQPAPEFLLDHMPKAYAFWTWNDYDENG